MARSIGYSGGRDYGYPDGGSTHYGGGNAPSFEVATLGASGEALSSITELAKLMKERRDKAERAAREAEAEFRRVTVDVPEGFVTRASQRVGGMDTPERKTATAWEAQRLWNEEKDRQKHAAEQSKAMEASAKELERSTDEVRKEGQKRRSDLMKLESDRQVALAKFEKDKAGHGVKAQKARARDEMAAARLGEEYNPAAHSTFDEPAPDVPSRAVYVYDPDWNIIGSKVLPVTDPRNFIRVGAPGQDEIFGGKPQAQGDGEQEFQKWYADRASKLNLNANPDAPEHFYDYRAAHAAGAEPDPTGHWPSQYKLEGHPRMVVDGVNTKTGEPVGSKGKPLSLAEITRQSVLAKRQKEESKAMEAEDAKWNTAFQKAESALHKQQADYKKADPSDPTATVVTPEDAIRGAWDWTLGAPPSPEDIMSGKVVTPKRREMPGQQAAAAPMSEEQKKAELEKRWAEGVEIGAQREAEAGRNPEAYRIRMETAKFGNIDIAHIRSEARRIAKTQGDPAAEAFLQRMQEVYKRKEPSLAQKAAAWTLRIGLPVAAGVGTGLVSGGTLALPAGGAAGLLGEELARRVEGGPPMTPGEVGVTTALGMLPGGGASRAATATTKEAIKRAALEASAIGAFTGGVGAATMPALGEEPRLPTAGGIATGFGTGAVVGGALGATISAVMLRVLGPKVAPAVEAAVHGDEQVQSLADRLAQTPPEGRAQVLEMLRARIHQLAAKAGPDAMPGAVQFEMGGPMPGEPGFVGPPQPTMEQMTAGQRSQAPDLLAQLTAEAGNRPGSSRFIGPMQPPPEPGSPDFIGPMPPEVGGAIENGPLTQQEALSQGQQALLDPEALKTAARAASDARTAELVAKKPWRRPGRGEEATLIGEELQGPLGEGQSYPLIPSRGESTPAGLLLPEGVRPPSPRAVERAGQPRLPGSPEAFQMWLAETKGINPQKWDALLNDPNAATQVDQLISAYNGAQGRLPEPPSFADFLQSKGIGKGEWDVLLNSESPDALVKVESLIREYNETAGFSDQGGPNPALENAPMSQEPIPRRGSEHGLSNLVADQIQQLQDEASVILERRQSLGTEPPSREFPEGRAGGGRKVVRGQSPEQIKADTDRLNEINDTINQLVGKARHGREVTPPQAETPTIAANAEIARAEEAIRAAEAALSKGGVTTQRRFENRVMRGEGEGGGAQPFKEVGFDIAGKNRLSTTPQEVPRAEFDVALQSAEDAVGGVRAAREATKNVPEVANAIRQAAADLERRLSALKAAQGVGRTERRPIAAIRDTAEALSLTREGLSKSPQDRALQTRARMLEERLVDLVGTGKQNRYRATRGQDGKFYVMRDATPEGAPFEGKVVRGREKAIAGPFKDSEQASQFAAEIEARWADIEQARAGDWPKFVKVPRLPKGAPPVKGKPKAGLVETPVTKFGDQRAIERGEALAVRDLQNEWAMSGRPLSGGGWEFAGAVPLRGLGKSKAVAQGSVPKRLRDEFTRTGKMSKVDKAVAALKLSPAQRAALNRGDTPPFEPAPADRTSGGGTSAEFLGLGTTYNAAKKALTGRFAKAALRGPRSTLKTLHEDFVGGDSIVEDFLNYQDRNQELSGRWKGEVQQAVDLLKTDAQKKDFVDVLEDSALMGAADPDVQLAAATVRGVLDEVAALAKHSNRFAQYLNDYFPHYALQEPTFRTQAELLARKLWNSDLHRTRMVDAGAGSAIDPEAISYAASQLIQPRSSGLDAKNVHLEKARSSTVAMRYRTDPEVLLQYMDAAARSVAQGEFFDRPIASGAPTKGVTPMGNQRLGKLRQDFADLRLENPGKETRLEDIETTLLRELGFHEGKRPGVIQRTVSDLRDLIASQKLMLSPITQMGSLADTAATFGYSGAAKALKAMGSTAAEQNATRAGSVSARSEHAARETAMQIRGAGGTQGKSPISNIVRGHKLFGPDAVWMDAMVTVDRKQRIGADSAARASLPELIGELNGGNAGSEKLLLGANVSQKLLSEIKTLDPRLVKRHLAGQPVPRDTLRVIDAYARRMTDFTQQRPSPSNLPPSWSTEGGRWLTMFMPFGLRQTQNMLTALRNNPKTFLSAGVPMYLLMGGVVNLMKGFAAGYGMIGENDSDRTIADKIQQSLSNRPVGISEGLDSPEDLGLRAAQAYLAAGPKPFALTIGEKAERGLESSGEATRALIGAGGSAVDAPVALVRGLSGLGQPEDVGRLSYAARGAASAAGHVLLPSTFAYQLQRELMPPEGAQAKKFRPTHKPGWIGRVADIPAEAKRLGTLEAARRALLGGTFGTSEYLSAERSKRKTNVEADKAKRRKSEERAKRKRDYAPPAFSLGGA